MTDDADGPEVPIDCPECGSASRVPLSEVADVLERHNEQRHGGDEVARVDPAIAEHVAELAAEDLDLL